MIKFKNLKTGEIKTAFSLREDGEKAYIKFSSDGNEYGYFKSNIEIVTSDTNQLPFRVYVYTKDCYKCHKPTEILTYITYADKPTENAVFPCVNRLSDKIESLKYFVIGDSETDIFIETIAEYSAILHIESHAENTQMYQVAAKTLEGTDENGEYCQAIIVKSGLLIGFVTDLFSLNGDITDPNYTDMQWLGLTTIVHEIGHAVDNQFVYKIRNTVNTKSAFDLNNPDDREEYILLSCISIWSEYFAESFVYDSFPMLRDKADDDTNNLMECAKNYYGQNIYAADRVYRIIYFFVHLLAQKGEACYESLFTSNSPLICYKDYLLNIGSELNKLKNVYPNWNIDTDLRSFQQNYTYMLIYEKTRRR